MAIEAVARAHGLLFFFVCIGVCDAAGTAGSISASGSVWRWHYSHAERIIYRVVLYLGDVIL